jgi:hypothetical protein
MIPMHVHFVEPWYIPRELSEIPSAVWLQQVAGEEVATPHVQRFPHSPYSRIERGQALGGLQAWVVFCRYEGSI